MGLTWLPVPGYEGRYEISDVGELRACDKIDHAGNRRRPRLLSPAIDPAGYRRAVLWQGGERKTWKVHQLVLLAFVGPRPDGTIGCHLDGDKLNNSAENLRWDTISANNYNNVRLGVHVQTRKTRCPQGHEYSVENTRHHKQGSGGWNARRCIQCVRHHSAESARRYRARAAAQRSEQ